MNFDLEIYTKNDYSLVEDTEERKESYSKFFDEVEAAYQYTKTFINNEYLNGKMRYFQTIDTVINISINDTSEAIESILERFEEGLKFYLNINNIADYTFKNYIEG